MPIIMGFKKFVYSQVNRFLKFSVVGAIITLLSMLVTYIFLGILKTPLYLTYASIYVSAILFSYALNKKYVFRSKGSGRKIILYFAIYLSSMGIGLIVLWFYKRTLPLENYLLSYLVIPITLSWNYILSSILFKKKYG